MLLFPLPGQRHAVLDPLFQTLLGPPSVVAQPGSMRAGTTRTEIIGRGSARVGFVVRRPAESRKHVAAARWHAAAKPCSPNAQACRPTAAYRCPIDRRTSSRRQSIGIQPPAESRRVPAN